MSEELRPCPFCGGEAQVNTWTLHGITESRCFCSNSDCPNSVRTVALEQWNTRPIEDALRLEAADVFSRQIIELEAANARLTAELSALRAEKAELDSGMHEMRAYRDGYDPKTKPPTETGEYLCLLRIGDPEIGDRFAVIDWDGTRFRCLDCTVLRYWPLPAGKGGE